MGRRAIIDQWMFFFCLETLVWQMAMEHKSETMVRCLRDMALHGHAPSVILREIIGKLGDDRADRQKLVRCFTEAFCFTEGEAYPIFGWLPDGTGKLKDADLDALLRKRIEQTRASWEVES